MTNKPSFDEIKKRIENDIAFHKKKLPDQFAVCWHGYIAALIEWNLISVNEHEQLCKLLPPIENNPVIAILLGQSNDFSS